MMTAAMPETTKAARHGGTLKLHRNALFGEVSKAGVSPRNPPQRPQSGDWHGSCHLTRARLGVAPDLPRKASRGGSRNSAGRTSDALTAAQVRNLIAATAHASAIGLPFNRFITIHWKLAGIPLAGMAKATGRFVDLLTKALARNESRTAWAWVHENGGSKGWHVHILAHVPAGLVDRITRLQKRWLRAITGRDYVKSVIKSKPNGGRIGLERGNPDLHGANLDAALAYVVKGAPQAVLDSLAIARAHEAGGHIIGKRCGTSQNIGAKARRGVRG